MIQKSLALNETSQVIWPELLKAMTFLPMNGGDGFHAAMGNLSTHR
jgi:hypothetical protein